MTDRLAFIDDQRLVRLLAATADGDRSAFQQLYSLTAPRVLAVLRAMLNPQQAEDVLQDAYIRIWLRAGDYRQGHGKGRGSPLGWMTAIARYRAIDVIRREGRSVALEDPDLLPGASETADGRGDERWDHGALHDCIGELNREQQRCLQLAYFGGASHIEVAEKTGSPLGTVKSWIRRGLEQLKRCLDA